MCLLSSTLSLSLSLCSARILFVLKVTSSLRWWYIIGIESVEVVCLVTDVRLIIPIQRRERRLMLLVGCFAVGKFSDP